MTYTKIRDRALTLEEVGEILKHCGNCAKLDLQKLTCFARTVLYFKKGQSICKAREISVKRYEEQLKQMIKYSLQGRNFVDSDAKRELDRVRRSSSYSLDREIKRAYWEDVYGRNRKFGKGEKKERSVSTKQKFKNNRLVIDWDERRRIRKRLDRLCTKKVRKKSY